MKFSKIYGLLTIALLTVINTFGQSLVIGLPNGHKGRLRDLSFNHNETLLATSSVDKTVKIWDVETGALIHDLNGHSSWIRQIQFSKSGDFIISASGKGEIIKWDILTGKQIAKLQNSESPIERFCMTPNGRSLYAGSWDGTIIHWDLVNGKIISKTEITHNGRIKDFIILPNQQILISAAEDNSIHVYDLETLKLIQSLNYDISFEKLLTLNDSTKILAFSDKGNVRVFQVEPKALNFVHNAILNYGGIYDGALLNKTDQVLFVSNNYTLHYYNPISNLLEDSISLPPHYYWSVQSSFDGKKSFLSTSDGYLITIDNYTKKITSKVKYHNGALVRMVASKNGNLLATASEDYQSKLIDISKGTVIKEYRNHASWIESVALSKIGGLMSVTQFGLNECLIKDYETGRKLFSLKGHTSWIRMSDFSPNGKELVTASDDGTAIIWDLDKREIAHKLIGHKLRVESAYFSSFGDKVITSSGDSTAIIWDVKTGKQILQLKGHTDWLRDAVFSSNGDFVASSGLDGSIRIWDAKKGTILHILKGHKNWVRSVRFDATSKFVLSASDDQTALLWDIEKEKAIQKFVGHTDWLRFARFHPDKKSIVTGSNDRTLRIWNIADGNCTHVLAEHHGVVEWADFSFDNQYLFTASGDGSVIVWDALNYDVILKSFVFDNDYNNWLVLHKSGLFDASPSAMSLMCWKKGLEIIGFEQLKTRYYEPNLWEKVLDRKPLRSVKGLSTLKLHPKIEIISDEDGIIIFNLIQRDGGIGNVFISINGIVSVLTPKELDLDLNKNKQEVRYDYRSSRHLQSSNNTIQISASSADGFVKGRGAVANVKYRKTQKYSPPNFFGVFVGIGTYANPDINLNFSVTDAVKMADAVELGAQKLFGKDRSTVYRLTTSQDKTISKEAIISVLKEIQTKSKPEDVLFLYFSGHGIAFGGGGDEGDFYYLTSQAIGADRSSYTDPNLRSEHLISTTELTKYLNKIPALKRFIVIDACGSGKAVDKLIAAKSLDASQIKAIDRMRDRTGLFVLSGCASDAVSYEASQFGQGLLTYSILQGLKGGALFDGKFADVNTLMEFSRDKVPELAKNIGGIQTPQLLVPKGGSFSFGIYEESEKSKIQIANPKEIFIQSHFVNQSTYEPDILFSESLDNRIFEKSKKNNATFIFMNVQSYDGASKLFGGIEYVQNQFKANITLKRGDRKLNTTIMANTKDELQESIIVWVTKNLD